MYKPMTFNIGRTVVLNWKKYFYCSKTYPYSGSKVVSVIHFYKEFLKGHLLVIDSRHSANGHNLITVKNIKYNFVVKHLFDSSWFYPAKEHNQFVKLSLYI